MAIKKGKKASKVKDLRVRGLTAKQAKGVKGGIIINYEPTPSQTLTPGLLPAAKKAQKV